MIQKFVAGDRRLQRKNEELAELKAKNNSKARGGAAPDRHVPDQDPDRRIAAGDRQGFGGKHHSTVMHAEPQDPRADG